MRSCGRVAGNAAKSASILTEPCIPVPLRGELTMHLKPLARAAATAVVAVTAVLTAVGPAAAAASGPSVVRQATPTPGAPAPVVGTVGTGLFEFGGATVDFVGRLIGTGGSGSV